MKCPRPTLALALCAPLLLCGCQYFSFFSSDEPEQTDAQEEAVVAATEATPAPAPAVAPAPAAPASAPGTANYIKDQAKLGETILAVKAQLDTFAKDHVNRANATLRPSRSQLSVTKEKGMYVARFLEVDPNSLTTEIYPSKAPGCPYVGHIVYLEKIYESVGDTKMKAEQGEFKHTRARRMREITRYSKGAWVY